MEGITTPLVEQCWLEGFQASQSGTDESKNPYPQNTKQSHFWQEGWWEGFFNEGNICSNNVD